MAKINSIQFNLIQYNKIWKWKIFFSNILILTIYVLIKEFDLVNRYFIFLFIFFIFYYKSNWHVFSITGSQVISEERRRVEELKRRVQDEVRSQWEERKMNCTSFNSVESGEESSSYSTGPTERWVTCSIMSLLRCKSCILLFAFLRKWKQTKIAWFAFRTSEFQHFHFTFHVFFSIKMSILNTEQTEQRNENLCQI